MFDSSPLGELILEGLRDGGESDGLVSPPRQLAVGKVAHALPELLHELGALHGHLNPRTEPARQAAVQHVAKAAPESLALALELAAS